VPLSRKHDEQYAIELKVEVNNKKFSSSYTFAEVLSNTKSTSKGLKTMDFGKLKLWKKSRKNKRWLVLIMKSTTEKCIDVVNWTYGIDNAHCSDASWRKDWEKPYHLQTKDLSVDDDFFKKAVVWVLTSGNTENDVLYVLVCLQRGMKDCNNPPMSISTKAQQREKKLKG
jgi:hypothetical protein